MGGCGGPAPLAVLMIVLFGCSPSGPRELASSAAPRSDGPKRITIAFPREMDLAHHLGMGRAFPKTLVNPGLSVVDDRDVRRPTLAEAVPTLDNGLWQVFPDGRMETTWTIRAGARWHDGAPFTTSDLLFTATVGRDREVAILSSIAWASVDELVALNERHDGSGRPDGSGRTITIRWKEPYIDADQVFSHGSTLPLPRHRLESLYLDGKAELVHSTFWHGDYVGTGPYRVRSWDPGGVTLLEANGDYVLGRPRIDEIEIRFILDGNTLTAAVLAGTVDIVADLESVDRGILVRDAWRDGQVVFGFDAGGALWLHPQFVNPRPSVILDLQFRRGLLHAIDRQNIADTLGGGVTPVAHSFMNPGQAAYREIEAAIPRYEYDPRRAAQLIEGLGYSRGADGFLHDQAGQRLEVDIGTVAAPSAANAGMAVADYWQRGGVGASAAALTPRLAQDPEAVATFPGFWIATQPKDLDGLWSLHSSRARLEKNRFQVPAPPNVSRYMNAEMDGLVGVYFRTIAVSERISLLGRIVHHVADQLPVMGIVYAARPDGFANRLVNVTTRSKGNFGTTPAWNAHEWDVRR